MPRFLEHKIETLFHNTANNVVQDDAGMIWIGSQNGLMEYDGYELKTLLPEEGNERSLCDGFITSLYCDRRGNIVAGTRAGGNLFRKGAGGFIRFIPENGKDATEGNRIQSIYEDTKGYYWLGTGQGLYRVHRDSFGTKSFILFIGDLSIRAVREDAKQRLWIATDHGLYTGKAGGNSVQRVPFTTSVQNQYDVFSEKDTLFIVGHPGMDIISLKTGTQQHIEVGGSEGNNRVQNLIRDRKGNIWAGTAEGLWLIRPGTYEKGQIKILTRDVAVAYSLRTREVLNVFEDRSGLIWISGENGITVYDPRSALFDYIDPAGTTRKLLSADNVWEILKDRNGDLWLGTMTGLDRIMLKDKKSKSPVSENIKEIVHYRKTGNNKGLDDDDVIAGKSLEDGTILFATETGVYRYDPGKDHFNKCSVDSAQTYSRITVHFNGVEQTANGKIWVLSLNNLYEYRKEDNSLHRVVTDTGFTSMLGMYADDDLLWISTDHGLWRLDPVTGKKRQYQYTPGKKNSIYNNVISGVYRDSKKRLWICSFGGGLNLLDEQADTFRHFTTTEGLAGNFVYGMLEDEKGLLWITTGEGLSKLDPVSMQFYCYRKAEGIVVTDFNQNAFFKDEDGRLFFGTHGLFSFYPAQEEKKNYQPPVVLTALRLNYILVADSFTRSLREGNALKLDHTKRVITIGFACLNYADPDGVHYTYQLEGFDTGWTAAPAGQRQVTYTNLPAGDYRFLVKAFSANGSEGKQLVLPISMLPPWWATWWFRILVVLIFTAVIVLIVRYFSRRKLMARLREVEVSRKVQEERIRISRDLHDNVGSQLTYIISNLELIGQQASKEEKLRSKLEALEDYSRNVMQIFRRSIWSMNKESFSFEEFENKLVEYTRQYLANFEKPKLEWKVTADDPGELKPLQALNLFRIVQEAINNIIKYADADVVVIEIIADSKTLQLTISDDGAGFDVHEKRNGFGLTNMEQRMKELNGTFAISAAKGTQIRLEMPF